MNHSDGDGLQWYKASASTGTNGCVEIAHLPGGGVAVRHSRHPDAAVLTYTAHEWECFLDGAKRGEFDPLTLGQVPVD